MSRRKRTSWIPTGRSIAGSLGLPAAMRRGSELLRQLHAVAVRVVHVEQAHLPLQLEDDADVDAGAAQPLGLGLEVDHVDGGDGAVLLRLALREPELHLTVLQVRPALVEVDRELLEAE